LPKNAILFWYVRMFSGKNLKLWVQALRLSTLPAGAAPVLLGSALAAANGSFDRGAALLCLGFAILAQVGSNLANDYLDGIRGTDGSDRIGPRRAVGAGLITPAIMKLAALGTLFAAFILGLFLIAYGGWWLLAVGVICVVCAWCYTGGPYPLAYHGWGDVCVVFFFGLVAVCFTYYVQAGSITLDAVLLGLGSGLLTNNILVVNNYRDLEVDQASDKRTLIVRFGRQLGSVFYFLAASAAASVVMWFWLRGYGWAVLLGLIPVRWSFGLGFQLKDVSGEVGFEKALRSAGQVVALYGVLLALGLAF
jgi:1,4-dihydroxy-2-naphthoate octaprenyltransferase